MIRNNTTKAYLAGFCKVAQDSGFDPDKLYKFAFELFGKKEKPSHSFGNAVSELLGTFGTSTAASTAAGVGATALIRALSKGRIKIDPFTGGAAGIIGGNLANVGGALAALFKDRRSKGEQKSYDRSGHKLKSLLIPGYGSYNMFKRIGRIIGTASDD